VGRKNTNKKKGRAATPGGPPSSAGARASGSDPAREPDASGGSAPPPPLASRRRWILAAAAVLAIAIPAALAYTRRATPVRRDAGLNVLLITIDTLRADALGCYGHPKVETPTIDALARDGVRFERAHAQNVVTLPSHANILSGRYPLTHGVRDNSGFRFPSDVDTLATVLKRAGYHTGAFVSAFPLDSRFGLDRGFDVYDDRLGDPESRTAFLMQERSGATTVAEARKWLAAQGDAKTFAWVHLYEPHFPYAPPEPFASRFAGDLYHGEVSAADAILRPLLDPLLQAGAKGRTLVVLTADHGEGLGEHGEMTHGIFAYETTLHVPMILFQPGLMPPRVVPDLVRHVDLLPTVLDALGIALPQGLPGRSLLPLATGHDDPGAQSYFEALSASTNRGWAPLHGLIRDRYKFIELPLPELYDLAADPRETKNLVASAPQVLEDIKGQLGRALADDRGVVKTEETAETRERLRALGYVASAGAPEKKVFTEDDDPKRLIALDAAVQDVVTLYQQHDIAGALAKAREIVNARPDMALASQHLAFLLRESGDLEAAVAALRSSVARHPEDLDGVVLLGGYLNEVGRPQEAARLLSAYAARADPDLDLLMTYGSALAQSGRTQEAMAVFNRALATDPSNANAKANLGTVYLLVRDYPRAKATMEEALALEPDVSRAHNALGVIAAETGHADEAIRHWKRAVELNPREFDTLFNLGKLLERQGRTEEARVYFERFVQEAPRALYARDIDLITGWLRSPTGRASELGAISKKS
jgi:arylsulfatase A-like enzyme/Tfp pilus assembly protein PilF